MLRAFDVERDHVELLEKVLDRLSPSGILIFSTNKRGFKMNAEALKGFEVEDLSATTIPEDFSRNSKIHRAYKITRKEKKRLVFK